MAESKNVTVFSQNFSTAQKTQARTNIGAVGSEDLDNVVKVDTVQNFHVSKTTQGRENIVAQKNVGGPGAYIPPTATDSGDVWANIGILDLKKLGIYTGGTLGSYYSNIVLTIKVTVYDTGSTDKSIVEQGVFDINVHANPAEGTWNYGAQWTNYTCDNSRGRYIDRMRVSKKMGSGSDVEKIALHVKVPVESTFFDNALTVAIINNYGTTHKKNTGYNATKSFICPWDLYIGGIWQNPTFGTVESPTVLNTYVPSFYTSYMDYLPVPWKRVQTLAWDGTTNIYSDIAELISKNIIPVIWYGSYHWWPVNFDDDGRFVFNTQVTQTTHGFLQFYRGGTPGFSLDYNNYSGFTSITYNSATCTDDVKSALSNYYVPAMYRYVGNNQGILMFPNTINTYTGEALHILGYSQGDVQFWGGDVLGRILVNNWDNNQYRQYSQMGKPYAISTFKWRTISYKDKLWSGSVTTHNIEHAIYRQVPFDRDITITKFTIFTTTFEDDHSAVSFEGIYRLDSTPVLVSDRSGMSLSSSEYFRLRGPLGAQTDDVYKAGDIWYNNCPPSTSGKNYPYVLEFTLGSSLTLTAGKNYLFPVTAKGFNPDDSSSGDLYVTVYSDASPVLPYNTLWISDGNSSPSVPVQDCTNAKAPPILLTLASGGQIWI